MVIFKIACKERIRIFWSHKRKNISLFKYKSRLRIILLVKNKQKSKNDEKLLKKQRKT